MKSKRPNLIDLPCEDILMSYILPLLSINDLFNLKLVSIYFNRITVDYFRTMKVLNLSKVKWLTNGQFKFILNLNHNSITQLDLSFNLSLNNLILTRYLIAFKFDQLNSIKFNDCHWIDTRSFTLLILIYGKQLQTIECAGCWNLDDETIHLVAIYCSNLKILNLSKIYSLTDQSLIHLGNHCNNLKSLNLVDDWKLTSFTIFWLINRFKDQLTDLFVDQMHLESFKKLNNSFEQFDKPLEFNFKINY